MAKTKEKKKVYLLNYKKNSKMAGRAQSAPKGESRFQEFKKTPAYTIGLNTVLFIAGIAFIQSPLMEQLVPQL